MSPVIVPFVDTNPSLESCWRAIILLGKNTACYKFALAQALLEVNRQNTKIGLETIALPYAKHIANHLKSNPKQITRNSSTFLSNCKQFNNGEITETKLTEQTMRYGFVNVLDAFHNVAGSTTEKLFFERKDTFIYSFVSIKIAEILIFLIISGRFTIPSESSSQMSC